MIALYLDIGNDNARLKLEQGKGIISVTSKITDNDVKVNGVSLLYNALGVSVSGYNSNIPTLINGSTGTGSAVIPATMIKGVKVNGSKTPLAEGDKVQITINGFNTLTQPPTPITIVDTISIANAGQTDVMAE